MPQIAHRPPKGYHYVAGRSNCRGLRSLWHMPSITKRLDRFGQAFFAGPCGHRPLQILSSYCVGADAHIRPLKQCGYPINQAVYYRRGHAVDNDGTGYRKHFRTNAQDKAFCCCQLRTHYFVFYSDPILKNIYFKTAV